MNRAELARVLDHSWLKPEATEKDMLAQVEVVRHWGIGFFCVQPSFVALATAALRDTGARVVSVIGFPHGCDRSTVKAHAAELAVRDGAAVHAPRHAGIHPLLDGDLGAFPRAVAWKRVIEPEDRQPEALRAGLEVAVAAG